ncbi:MAG TPA: glucose-1-phosphate adenylyltransferase [Dehalococcoidia bacterium]|nr:glucose-1-phosphate adenylyltransferase [Dehalococcoidia bacterium]
MNRVLALILAGGRGERLSILAEERAKPAVIFGGKYRIIDFALSNCINSGLFRVGILTQYRPRSLNNHIGIGRPWDLDRSTGGVSLLQPYIGRKASDWYKGTADAVYQNLYFVEESQADQVLILAGDHIYKMRYEEMLDFHRSHKADVTVGVVEVPLEEARRYGVLSLDKNDRIVDFQEKPSRPQSNLASMGIYVFKREALMGALEEDAHRRSGHDFGHDVIPARLGRDRVFGYRFGGYWRDIGTIDAYWQANMDLLAELPELNLYDPDNIVRTEDQQRPPLKAGPNSRISRSILSSGCIINGNVQNSVISPGVFVEEGATVVDSILFDDCHISTGALVERSILDKMAFVGAHSHVGWGEDYSPNQEEPQVLHSGITIVGKRARIPTSIRIGRNCIIGPGAAEEDVPGDYVASGSSISATGPILGPP